MIEQMDIFASSGGKARLTKPLRLIELFAGYGSQRLSLKYLGVPCESWCVSEWATNSIRAYKDLHCGDANEDYAATMTDDEIRAWMLGRISKDYNVPLTEKQIAKIKHSELRQIYNDMRNSRNLGSICLMHGSDLNIVDTDKYDYILTYSFPCQDLSTAGTMGGMHEGSGTRSSLLWEVKRLLTECTELPAMLLCENVPQVLAKKNIGEFQRFISFLDSLGYKSYYKIINATSFGIPQTRKRFFMVSLLADEPYSFPEERPLKDKLKHYLEHNVAEKYYIPQETVEKFMSQIGNVERERERGVKQSEAEAEEAATDTNGIWLSRDKATMHDTSGTIGARYQSTGRGTAHQQVTMVTIPDKIIVRGNYHESNHEASRIVDPQGSAQTVKENHGTVTAVVETPENVNADGTKIIEELKVPSATKKGYEVAKEGDSVSMEYPTSKTRCGRVGGVSNTILTGGNECVVVKESETSIATATEQTSPEMCGIQTDQHRRY